MSKKEKLMDLEDEVQDLSKKCCLLKKNIANDFKLTRLYVQAMSFLNWFDFERLSSEKLRKEAANKKYTELTKYSRFNTYNEYALCFNDDEFKELEMGYFTISGKDYSDITILNDTRGKLNKPETSDWKRTVAYVKQRPFEFDEDVVIAVYNYLKDILKKDADLKKYTK